MNPGSLGVPVQELWPKPGEELTSTVESFIRKYCVLEPAAYLPLTVWCIATYVADQFDCFPYLALESPIKRCGKTRLLETAELICSKPWRGTAPTSAALYRMMTETPTLLLDEVESLSFKNTSEAMQSLLAILNAGHRRGATVPRCSGKDQRLEFFPVYGPKAFAVIGKLPDTLADRSIIFQMHRKKPNTTIDRFLFARAKASAQPIRIALEQWAQRNDENVRIAYETLTDLSFLTDRDADLWMPLFAACSVIAPSKVVELKDSAVSLSRAKKQDESDDLVMQLLTDIRNVFPTSATHISTAELLRGLKKLEESPWSERATARQLAQWLKPFGVSPRQVRLGNATMKGYLRAQLEEVFARYLPEESAASETYETN